MEKQWLSFQLGRTVATPRVLHVLEELNISPSAIFSRHERGEWDDVNAEDWQVNERALIEGDRLFSVYRLTDEVKIYVITEPDRSHTVIMLPEEY